MITKITHDFKGPQYSAELTWLCWAASLGVSWFRETPEISLADMGRISFNNRHIGVKLL